MVAVGLVVIASIAIFVINSSVSPEREAEGKAAVRWVKNYVARNLPMTSLRLASVTVSSGSVIEITITVSRTRDPKLFKDLKNRSKTARRDTLRVVCPRSNSGVYKLLDQKWSLWVVFSGDNKKLTDGGCQYQQVRS